jgi:hypothetical protein
VRYSPELNLKVVCGSASQGFDVSLIKIVTPSDLIALGPEDNSKLDFSVEGLIN